MPWSMLGASAGLCYKIPFMSVCERCQKEAALCVCEGVTPLETRLRVLILQHPQEPDKQLGTARLCQLSLASSLLKIGLSWRNLKAVLGAEASPSRWAVLYLGSGLKLPGNPQEKLKPGLYLVSKNGALLPEQEKLKSELEGIVVLDGTWSQAKTLWWRNPWLLKLKRAIYVPETPSQYKELRREPRRECLSTLETVGRCLTELGEDPQIEKRLDSRFTELLNRYRKLPRSVRR